MKKQDNDIKKTKIYLVTNCYGDINKVYVGKTVNLELRKKDHIKKYGPQIEYTEIDEISSLQRKDWEFLETYWIQQFQAWGFQMMNKCKRGGWGPEFRTEECKKRISLKNKKPKPGVSKKLKGRKSYHKKDTGDKISKTKKGTTQSEEWKANRSKAMKGKKNRLGTRFPNGYKKTIK